MFGVTMRDHHQLAGLHCKTSLIISCLVTTTCSQSKSITGNPSIMYNQSLWKHLRINGGAGDWIFSSLMQGLLVIGHDGSYMPHLANNLCACAAVFYCSHTNQYADVTWVEKSTKKAANNYCTKILGVCSTQLIIKVAITGRNVLGHGPLTVGCNNMGVVQHATVLGTQCWRSNHNQILYGTSKALWLCPELEDGCITCAVTQTSTC
jgi:hypothetical protein